MNVLITGPAATGKSTIAERLRAQGYTVICTDNDGRTRLLDIDTLEPLKYKRGDGWSKLSRLTNHFHGPILVNELEAGMNDNAIHFFEGYADNIGDFSQYFRRIYLLSIDTATMIHRLQTRTSGDWGKDPDELEHSLTNVQPYETQMAKLGAITIMNTGPIEQTTHNILHDLGEV